MTSSSSISNPAGPRGVQSASYLYPSALDSAVAVRQAKSKVGLPFRVDGITPYRANVCAVEGGQMPKNSRNSDWDVTAQPQRKELLLEILGNPPQSAPGPVARADLLDTIRDQIIPQLVIAHFADPAAEAACPDGRLPPDADEVAAFSRIAVSQDLPMALAYIEDIVNAGISIETVLLQLVAPAARLLGDEWLDDMRTFTEVTIGLTTLQEVVHVLGPSFADETVQRGSVVLVAAPNEQHTLGVYLLGEFLRRAGWGVIVDPNMHKEELLSRLHEQHIEMVGISVSNSDLLEPTTRLVREIKRASMNREMLVMIGGSLQLADHAEEIGAMFCNDPRAAVRHLDQHTRQGARSRPS